MESQLDLYSLGAGNGCGGSQVIKMAMSLVALRVLMVLYVAVATLEAMLEC